MRPFWERYPTSWMFFWTNLHNLNTWRGGLDKDLDLDHDTDALFPFKHDPIPEHEFDESEFSIKSDFS